ncbi:MAG: prepilin-type N-terminal cleavage/methylation domain-containing protein [Ruminiclostridium sp.]|nr:prepilin-type N-terminal cleavage/methylation domain-containing protein [Ruminiclostridium sp.]
MERKRNHGFTLTELMIVVVVIGVLVAVAVPVTHAARKKAENNACVQNQHIIHTEAVRYFADHGVHPDDTQELVDHDYLQTMPLCMGKKYGQIVDGFVTCPDGLHTEPIQ